MYDIPNRLDLEITRQCKYKCGVCSVRAQSKINENEISLIELQNQATEFYKLGGKEVSITGGEPSERGMDFLCALIKHCKFLCLKVRMYSVGYGFQNAENVQALKNVGLDDVIVTLVGPKEIDEQYKGVKGSFDVAVNAIQLFRKCGIEVVIHFTPTKLTYAQLPFVIDIADRLGVEKIRVMAFVPQGRGWDNREIFEMNDLEKKDFNEILHHIKSKSNVDLQFSGDFESNEAGSSSCMVAKNRFVITSDGTLIPSFAVRMYKKTNSPPIEFNLGSIQTTSLFEAWTSPLLLQSRNKCQCGLCTTCLGKSLTTKERF